MANFTSHAIMANILYNKLKDSDRFRVKINKDKLLSKKSILILKEVEKLVGLGLPRGLSISPVLSEIFMKEIDKIEIE